MAYCEIILAAHCPRTPSSSGKSSASLDDANKSVF